MPSRCIYYSLFITLQELGPDMLLFTLGLFTHASVWKSEQQSSLSQERKKLTFHSR